MGCICEGNIHAYLRQGQIICKKTRREEKGYKTSFGVLKCRWCVIKLPARLYDRGQLENVVLACIILHNMIVEYEKTKEALRENLK
jgi:hypothetical protein